MNAMRVDMPGYRGLNLELHKLISAFAHAYWTMVWYPPTCHNVNTAARHIYWLFLHLRIGRFAKTTRRFSSRVVVFSIVQDILPLR